jgi:hypothetical protein
MKKLALIFMVLFVVYSVQAATIDRNWTSKFTAALTFTGSEDPLDGAGWWVEVFNQTDDAATSGNTTATLGWADGFGYVVNTFTFGPATEADSVLLRLYNNANPFAATHYIDSATQILADLDDLLPPSPGATDVTFNFSSSSWQAVPEPATAMLFSVGGMGAWMLRRRKQQAQIEADLEE